MPFGMQISYLRYKKVVKRGTRPYLKPSKTFLNFPTQLMCHNYRETHKSTEQLCAP